MSKHTLDITAFAAQTWLIDPEIRDIMLAQLVTEGQLVLSLDETPVHFTDYNWAYYSPASQPNSTAVLTIKGVIYDYYAQYIADKLSLIYADKNVSSLLVRMNSPGGSADAGYLMADALMNAPIPTWCQIDYGQASSAGYMIACSCDGVTASRANDRVGSIGTYISYQDWSKYYEKAGILLKDIYAKQSTEKNIEGREAAKGNFKPLEAYVSQEAQSFIDYVKSRRPVLDTKTFDPFTGKVFSATDALSIGLIDGITDLKGAVKLLNSSSTISNTTPRTTMALFGYVKATALMALASAAITDENLKAANEELTALGVTGAQLVSQTEFEALVSGSNNQADATALTTANNKINELTDQIKGLTTERDGFKADAAKFGAMNAAEKTQVVATGETAPDAGDSADDASAQLIANLPHNKALENTWLGGLGAK